MGGVYLRYLGLATSFPTSEGAGCNFLGSRRREKVSGGWMLSQLEQGLELRSQMLNSGSLEAERDSVGNLGWVYLAEQLGNTGCVVGPSEWELGAGRTSETPAPQEAPERDKKCSGWVRMGAK